MLSRQRHRRFFRKRLQSAIEPVHSRFQFRGEHNPLPPVEVEIAEFLLHLRGHFRVVAEYAWEGERRLPVLVGELKLALDGLLHGPGMGIVDQDRNLPIGGLGLSGGEGEEGAGFQSGEDFEPVIHHAQAHVLHGLDGGTGEDVVELGGEQIALRFGQILRRVFDETLHGGGRQHFLRGEEFVFESSVLLFDAHLGCVASDGPRVDVMRVGGEFSAASLQVRDVGFGCGVHDLFRTFLDERGQIGQVLSGGTTSVISHAPQHNQRVAVRMALNPAAHLVLRLSQRGVVVVRQADHDFRSVVAYPRELAGGEGRCGRTRAAADVRVIPAFCQDLD